MEFIFLGFMRVAFNSIDFDQSSLIGVETILLPHKCQDAPLVNGASKARCSASPANQSRHVLGRSAGEASLTPP